MATKPTVKKKQKNGNLTKNGKPKYKSLSVVQLQKLVESISKPKEWAKVMREICRKDGITLKLLPSNCGKSN